MSENTCGSCGLSSGWVMTKHSPPRINTRHYGQCGWKEPIPALPKAVTECYGHRPTHNRCNVHADQTDCPCWQLERVQESVRLDDFYARVALIHGPAVRCRMCDRRAATPQGVEHHDDCPVPKLCRLMGVTA